MLQAANQGAAAAPFARRAPEQDMQSILPPPPKTIQDTGLERQLVLALLAKAIHQAGIAHLGRLAARLRLSISVLREAFELLAGEHLVEIAGRGDTEIDIQYRLTERGKQFAATCLAECRYVGAAPVTLDAFRDGLAADAARNGQASGITPTELAAVLADEGFDNALREQLGAALHSGRAILLHGASGSGKSALARKLALLLQGVVAVPDAIVVGQQIIEFHDPRIHLRPAAGRQYEERRNCDARWRVCQRPLVLAGAELTRAMLEPRFDAAAGVYRAPPHLKASGGLFVIDDLGRQQVPAAELLNRFIGALDSGADLLTLEGGHAETVPFAVTLVLATSHAPQQLLDEPLLRRIGYKIELGALGVAAYRALLRRQCAALRVPFDEDAADHLLARLHASSGRPLLASYPRALLERVCDHASFAGRAPRLSVATLEQAWNSVFACTAPPSAPAPALSRSAVLSGERP
jgi:energy-coupling factor transporter ATP-binding protein EcfA2